MNTIPRTGLVFGGQVTLRGNSFFFQYLPPNTVLSRIINTVYFCRILGRAVFDAIRVPFNIFAANKAPFQYQQAVLLLPYSNQTRLSISNLGVIATNNNLYSENLITFYNVYKLPECQNSRAPTAGFLDDVE